MITKNDLNLLYNWASNNNTLPLKKSPTSEGYCNKSTSYCWIKGVGKTTMIRKKLIQNELVEKIYENDDILFSMIALFEEGTELKPHKDPNIYKEPYKRIQIPLIIPNKEQCFMIWKGEKIYWIEGKPRIFEVMDYIHEGYNLSDKPMKFLFLDVKKSCQVEID